MVKNISVQTKAESLRSRFTDFGHIIELKCYERITKQIIKSAYIKYRDKESAHSASQQNRKLSLDGNILDIERQYNDQGGPGSSHFSNVEEQKLGKMTVNKHDYSVGFKRQNKKPRDQQNKNQTTNIRSNAQLVADIQSNFYTVIVVDLPQNFDEQVMHKILNSKEGVKDYTMQSSTDSDKMKFQVTFNSFNSFRDYFKCQGLNGKEHVLQMKFSDLRQKIIKRYNKITSGNNNAEKQNSDIESWESEGEWETDEEAMQKQEYENLWSKEQEENPWGSPHPEPQKTEQACLLKSDQNQQLYDAVSQIQPDQATQFCAYIIEHHQEQIPVLIKRRDKLEEKINKYIERSKF